MPDKIKDYSLPTVASLGRRLPIDRAAQVSLKRSRISKSGTRFNTIRILVFSHIHPLSMSVSWYSYQSSSEGGTGDGIGYGVAHAIRCSRLRLPRPRDVSRCRCWACKRSSHRNRNSALWRGPLENEPSMMLSNTKVPPPLVITHVCTPDTSFRSVKSGRPSDGFSLQDVAA